MDVTVLHFDAGGADALEVSRCGAGGAEALKVSLCEADGADARAQVLQGHPGDQRAAARGGGRQPDLRALPGLQRRLPGARQGGAAHRVEIW